MINSVHVNDGFREDQVFSLSEGSGHYYSCFQDIPGGAEVWADCVRG